MRLTVLLAALLVAAIGPAGPPRPVTEADFRPVDEAAARLGRLLFYDKILSGNRNIACGTCHDHTLHSADALSLGVGEGGEGLGEKRRTLGAVEARVPRNSPALFNLGAREVRAVFWDGRVEEDASDPSGFHTPAEDSTPKGLRHVLAAQALFPLASTVEMAGGVDENKVAAEGSVRLPWAWRAIEERVRGVPAYLPLFREAFPDVAEGPDISIVHVANAIGEFVSAEWRAVDSPFDRFLRGEARLTPAAARGMDLFYGRAGCGGCHSGPFLTDRDFHAIAMPQLGPGRTRRFDPGLRDAGRMNRTDRAEDAYRFRTPSLRNVALTAPYGHSGAYATLEGVVRHHLDPVAALKAWDPGQVALPADQALAYKDFGVWEDAREIARIAAANELAPAALTDGEVADIVAFLHALTDAAGAKGRLGKPDAVPSGLPVD